MLERIDRIRQSFITRKTEQSDGQGYIHHHALDYYKNNDHDKGQDHIHDDDMTDISVESLIIFLEGLLRDQNTTMTQGQKPINDTMRQAISAYDKSPHPQRRFTYLDRDEQNYDPAFVKRLITSLRQLKAEGIAHISLIEAEGFLESIEKTLEKIQAL